MSGDPPGPATWLDRATTWLDRATTWLDRATDWLYRHRGETAVPFAVGLVVLARPTWSRIALGSAIVAIGECLRIWAAGHIGNHARGRTFREPTAATLARGGPYRLMPHPLYAGNLIVCAGLLVMGRAGEPWFPALFFLLFCLQYSLFIRREDGLKRQGVSAATAWPATPGSRTSVIVAMATAPAAPKSATVYPHARPTPIGFGPAVTRAGLALEWPTLRTVLVLVAVLAGLAWWWSGR